jgi:hypothetical protein
VRLSASTNTGEAVMQERTTVTIAGVTLPCLAMKDEPTQAGYSFVVPLENGWNAYVVGFPRPDETEFSVAPITRAEADAVAAGQWGIGCEIGWAGRPDLSWPRGEDDLLDSLQSMALWPSPEVGMSVR